jgi:CDP-6-deoxy-D-xylo-4-hexulose-3-dehydrase
MKFPLALDTWDNDEQDALKRVIKSNRYSMGPEVFGFESEICEMFGSKHAIMVNSGSSANLIMLTALKLLYGRDWPKNPEIIVPALSWSTTFTPFYYLGLKPVFIDINPDSLCLEPEILEKAITPNTVGILTVNILGQASELETISQIADKNRIVLLEDNCESLGATLNNQYTGRFGLASSHSSFYSHHISTMEGGWIQTDNDEFADICKSLRAHGWIRELGDSSKIAKRTGVPFRDQFNFILPGLNFRPIEFEGALGKAQLIKLPEMLEARRRNALVFNELFKDFEGVRIQSGPGLSSWFAFSLVLEGKLEGHRDELANKLIEHGIECRPIIAGNFTKQPVMQYLNGAIPFPLKVCDQVHDNGLYVGNHPFNLSDELKSLHKIVVNFKREIQSA